VFSSVLHFYSVSVVSPICLSVYLCVMGLFVPEIKALLVMMLRKFKGYHPSWTFSTRILILGFKKPVRAYIFEVDRSLGDSRASSLVYFLDFFRVFGRLLDFLIVGFIYKSTLLEQGTGVGMRFSLRNMSHSPFPKNKLSLFARY